jgi:hypothetical protein
MVALYMAGGYMAIDQSLLISSKIDFLDHGLIESFNHLENDTISYDLHSSKPHESLRFRNLHCLKYRNGLLTPDKTKRHLFAQPRKFHVSYLEKLPKLIENDTLLYIQKIIHHIISLSPAANKSAWIGINQVRVISKNRLPRYVAPGFHQDGYHYSIHLCVNRQNIEGGMSIISALKTGENPILKKELSAGEFIFFDDQHYYHTATPIKNKNLSYVGYRDMLIVDILYW